MTSQNDEQVKTPEQLLLSLKAEMVSQHELKYIMKKRNQENPLREY